MISDYTIMYKTRVSDYIINIKQRYLNNNE